MLRSNSWGRPGRCHHGPHGWNIPLKIPLNAASWSSFRLGQVQAWWEAPSTIKTGRSGSGALSTFVYRENGKSRGQNMKKSGQTMGKAIKSAECSKFQVFLPIKLFRHPDIPLQSGRDRSPLTNTKYIKITVFKMNSPDMILVGGFNPSQKY